MTGNLLYHIDVYIEGDKDLGNKVFNKEHRPCLPERLVGVCDHTLHIKRDYIKPTVFFTNVIVSLALRLAASAPEAKI